MKYNSKYSILLLISIISILTYSCKTDCDCNELIEENNTFYFNDNPYTGVCYTQYDKYKKEKNFLNGKYNGRYIIWDEEGTVICESVFIDGEKDGLTTIWYENGDKFLETNYDALENLRCEGQNILNSISKADQM